MKVFLDVGAHLGQTLYAVLDHELGFDRIVCFEPVESNCEVLERCDDPRVEVLEAGLSDCSATQELYGAGDLGGGVYRRDSEADGGERAAECRFIRATDWIEENVATEDEVFMKLNCEGSECDVLEDLLDSGAIHLVDHIMVDFDIRKIPGQRHREYEVRRRLALEPGLDVRFAEDAMIGLTHAARIRNWLRLAEGRERSAVLEGIRRGLIRAVFVLKAFVKIFTPSPVIRRIRSYRSRRWRMKPLDGSTDVAGPAGGGK